MTHGVILDFVGKLKKTPDTLEVLGDGTRQKAYLHVDDLVPAMLYIRTLPGGIACSTSGLPTTASPFEQLPSACVNGSSRTRRSSSAKAIAAGWVMCRASAIRSTG